MSNPLWYEMAAKDLGVREVPGPDSNPEIMAWAKGLGGWEADFYKGDDVAWCGLTVAHWMREAGIARLPANPFSALAWASWGVPLQRPAVGAILVFRRPGGGHVGLYVGENATAYRVRGGNQGDAVSEIWVEKSRLVAIRWVSGQPMPDSGPVTIIAAGATSTNEA